MRRYVITESPFEATLLTHLLGALGVEDVHITSGGRGSSALSLAKSVASDRDGPVALLMATHMANERAAAERELIWNDLLHTNRALRGPLKLFTAHPEPEIILFGAPEALSTLLILPPLNDSQILEARYQPAALLDRLLRASSRFADKDAFARQISAEDAAPFAQHPLIQAMAEFLRTATSHAPAHR